MEFQEWTAAIRDLPMEDVCDALGIERQGDKIICPNHDDHNFGSCRIFNGSKYHCFACRAGGDNIVLAQSFLHTTWKNAAETLAGYFSIGTLEVSEENTGFPFSRKQLEALMLIPGKQRILLPEEFTETKPQDFHKFDGEYYVTGEEVRYGITDLFKEDRETFLWLMGSRVIAMQKYYAELYEEEVWKIFGHGMQSYLEDCMELVKGAGIILQSLGYELPEQVMPKRKPHTPRYGLVI